MSEESKELELVEKRLDVLERTLFGNGHKGLKAELVELKTQIETFKRIAVWHRYFGRYFLCGFKKYLLKIKKDLQLNCN